MHPTNNNGEIFPCNNCSTHAQPPAKSESRKKVAIHDRENNEHHYISLTAEQVALLEWLENEYIIDTDRYVWEILTDHDFEEI